ncbi:MAG: hypothetical protein ACI8UX_000647, partial [Psychromonas sp.]
LSTLLGYDFSSHTSSISSVTACLVFPSGLGGVFMTLAVVISPVLLLCCELQAAYLFL